MQCTKLYFTQEMMLQSKCNLKYKLNNMLPRWNIWKKHAGSLVQYTKSSNSRTRWEP